MDAGLVIVRLVVGVLFIGHGTQKLFGWFGGHGLEGTGNFFDSIGLRPGRPLAAIAGLTETTGGLLLGLGFLTPLGAAMIVGVMMVASMSAHLERGLWNTEGGFELPLVYACAALVLAFTGPGAYSIDGAVGLDLSGIVFGVGAAGIGIAGGMLVGMFRRYRLEHQAELPDEPQFEEPRWAA